MFLVVIVLMDPRFASQVVGVAQAINKKSGEDGAFTDQDEKVWGACIDGHLLPAAPARARAGVSLACPDALLSTSTGFFLLLGFFGHRPPQRSALRDVTA